ncbi:MAG: hypothetical protein D6791_19000, partial [Chloroflexi bacterium]
MAHDGRTAPGVFRHGVLLTGVGYGVNIVLLLAETVLIVRWLPAEEFGTVVLFQTTVTFLVMAIDFGCRTAAARFIAAEAEQRPAIVSSLMAFRFILLAVAALLILVVRVPLAALTRSELWAGLILYVPAVLFFASFDELLAGMLQGFQVYSRLAKAQILRSTLRLSLTAGLLLGLKLGIMAVVWAWLVSFACSALYQWLGLPRPWHFGLDRALLRRLLRFGLPLQLTRFLWFTLQRVDVFLLATLAGPASVAFYEVAARIPLAFQRLSEAYFAVFLPTLSERFAQGGHAAAELLLARSIRLLSFMALCATWGAALFGTDIIRLLFSARYTASGPAFGLLMLAFTFSLTANLMGYTLTALGR